MYAMPGDDLAQQLEDRKKRRILESAKHAGLGGLVSGIIGGGTGKLMAGERSMANILKAAGNSGLLFGGLAAGATAMGGAVMGAPDPEDPGGYSKSGGYGGLIGGGIAGAGLGALIGAGKMKVPAITGVTDNIIAGKLAALAGKPSVRNAKIGALIGGGALGGAAGFRGMEEGMQLDFLNNQVRKLKKDRMKQREIDHAQDMTELYG
jgi:hypothetical protein